jgi:uncharacterized protein (TIGR00730 family)
MGFADDRLAADPFVDASLDSLQATLKELVVQLPCHKHKALVQQALQTLVSIASHPDLDRLDWKILTGSLSDMERAFEVFAPHRHTRKIAVFGSARTAPSDPDYQMAESFSRSMANQGFMVMTGGGPGIMQAANAGAGRDRSFGLNVELPFEQESNPFIAGDAKLIDFKYFFTRKLFFLRETDGIACFPGGFGTMDELFECLTLIQTGKFGPAPVVLVDRPGGNYWQEWDVYIRDHFLAKGLINAADRGLYTITDRLDVASEAIARFYRVYHSSRYVGSQFVMRLNVELSDAVVDQLNGEFGDILVAGSIAKTQALPQELGDETVHLPRLQFEFNQRDTGRLYQLIDAVNRAGTIEPETLHPEQK